MVGVPEKILGDIKSELDANNIGIVVFPQGMLIDSVFADYDLPYGENGEIESSKVLAVINSKDGIQYLMEMDDNTGELIEDLGDSNLYPKDMADAFLEKVTESGSDYWADQTYTPYDSTIQLCLAISEMLGYISEPIKEPVKIKE